MTNKRSTKRALIASAISLLLCFTMLLGTTYAWFTDSVTSTNNIIKSGNLDIVLEYYDADAKDWAKVDENTNVFSDQLWEPGHTEVVYLRVTNAGSLALKYNLGVNVYSETPGVNVAGNTFMLSDYIMFGVDDGKTPSYADRDAAIEAVKDNAKIISKGYAKSNALTPEVNNVDNLALVVYMPETVGNDANHKTGTNPPVINLGLNLFATQTEYEEDSFGDDYDATAPWVGNADTAWYDNAAAGTVDFTLDTAAELAGLAQIVNSGKDSFEGKTITLAADLDLNNTPWTPIGDRSATAVKFNGTFNGAGHTISNLKVVGSKGVGLFGATWNSAHIENVKVVNAYVSGNDYVGTIVGGGYLSKNCIKNCTVENATVIATPYLMENGKYDGGAKAGVIAGQIYNGHIIGNTVKNSTVSAYRDLGGIVGMLAIDGGAGVEASGNTVENVTLSYVGVAGAYADNTANGNMAAVVGRAGENVTVSGNTDTGVTENEANKGVTAIYTVDELVAFAAKVNGGNNFAGKTVILGADIDLSNREWTPIGTDATPFNGTFDGNGKTISNLKITSGKSNVGLFGRTNDGEIKNLTVENALVTGRLNVGVVAGTPYTSKFTNITVAGHVEVNGFAYVGGVGGKNAYADWTNIAVKVDETSYVKANSVENGTAYRTYVGGVVGFMGEGGHTFENVTSNIDVIGSTCDVGGITGIAHYDNSFINCVSTGDVTITDAAEAAEAEEIGGIAGVWHNETGHTVTFKDCEFTGTLTSNFTDGVDLSNNTITGKAYNATGKGTLVIINYYDHDGATYVKDGVTGEDTLYVVPADYAESTFTVADGTEAIGNFAFASNSNVKEVNLPSTVRDLGRGFDSSTVEKVVLNEGLTTISSRAFRSTTALKEVVISSTVTTIADNAFQKSGIKTITIPANVKTIGENAFGASLVETVIIEGDIDIEGYAFRGCSKLSTVYLNGLNVNFVKSTLNGRDSMWFCNGESNNPNTSNITFYVKNDIIKERVLTAMGAERNNTTVICEQTPAAGENGDSLGYYIDNNGNAYAYDSSALKNALASDAEQVYVGAGEYVSFPTSSVKEGTTIVCSEGTVFEGTSQLNIKGSTVVGATFSNNSGTSVTQTINGTFKDCEFTGSNALRYCYAGETVVFENCVFDGAVYGVHFDGGANDVTFKNCVISGFNAFGGAVTKLTLEGCTFKKGIGGYNGVNLWGDTDVKNCTFIFDGTASEWIDLMGSNKTATFENCVVTDGVNEKDIKTVIGDYGTGNTIIVDGVEL